MLQANDRISTLLKVAIREMDLLASMTAGITKPDDFLSSLHGMTVYRACGMRNFLSHEYGEVDAEGIFNTVKTDIPTLLEVTKLMNNDLGR